MPHVNPTIETWGAGDQQVTPYVINENTLKNSGYVGSDNAMASPDYFIPYDGVHGPDDGHKWLAGHPFY
eukprot:CAMPEP_0179448280 /NCGR_PEP_ID=MMETSP0799-20121207/32144_1 /TAXON_ID=46947 /ORGANISM="Geminigera cryophila, Strain CCMP2564" /LENGTH=68 /DNA_ID=CAMNT_0021240001 /DNA_START=74 /DNA_END=280 /DNA_ORIENTATION=+